MDYLQYEEINLNKQDLKICFKPYYKWITFNITKWRTCRYIRRRFKPYYKWITFNIKGGWGEIT